MRLHIDEHFYMPFTGIVRGLLLVGCSMFFLLAGHLCLPAQADRLVVEVPANDAVSVVKMIVHRESGLEPSSDSGLAVVSQGQHSRDTFSVSMEALLSSQAEYLPDSPAGLRVVTHFSLLSSTINKSVIISAPDGRKTFTARLTSPADLDSGFAHNVLEKYGRSWLVYDNGTDVFAYNQAPGLHADMALKEWIYARTPNNGNGSRYDWLFESSLQQVMLKDLDERCVGLFQVVPFVGSAEDQEKGVQRRTAGVRMVFPQEDYFESTLVAVLEPIVFWTKNGTFREGRYELTSFQSLAVIVEASPEEYPLLIDPTLNYGKWLGSNEDNVAIVYALAVDSDEIYAGGSSSGFMAIDVSGGTYTRNDEGFVIEISDGAPPSVVWVQWLGGSHNDCVYALAVNGDEVYAGGYSVSITSWDTAIVTAGTYNASSQEGWVVEIADGSSPVLAWQQWLGGSGDDRVYALAVNGDEVYAGGYSSAFTSWETAGSTAGSFNPSAQEGWVVEIADGNPPVVAWVQWLGGSGVDSVKALAVNGDEVYAGGSSAVFTSWETAGSTAGTYNASSSQGWVVEIADGSPPVISWSQWLGGGIGSEVLALAVNEDEVYAGGLSNDSVSWETVGVQNGTYGGDGDAFIVEIADNSPPTVSWLQWLGGTQADTVYSLAVNGDEIYAGGFSGSTPWAVAASFSVGTFIVDRSGEGWVAEIIDGSPPSFSWRYFLGDIVKHEAVQAVLVTGEEVFAGGWTQRVASFETFGLTQGTCSPGAQCAFVVELADGAPPSGEWILWLGGRNAQTTDIKALAVNDDEIYAGGSTGALTLPGTALAAGTFNGDGSEGWVAEIADGPSPAVIWVQWLGGSSNDFVYAIGVNGDEVYAGGYSDNLTSWETAGSTAGTYNASNQEGWVVEIADGSPPVVAWRQWLGGIGDDRLYALAVNGDEVYAGGYSSSFTSWETAGSTAGSFNPSAQEGWVVEIADGSPPVVTWRQWLGGGHLDIVYALAVNGDEVYAGGYSVSFTSWETAGSTAGTYNASSEEGWVVEIADGSPPVLAWVQWLGGGNSDSVYALAVNGDEVYAGGYSVSFTSWETAGSTAGTYNASSQEGWVVEIADGSPPVVAWRQWLGGSGDDRVYALAVNGDEVYAGGYSANLTSWETAGSTAGTYNASSQEGWVVEIADGSPPTIVRQQWLGGDGTDYVYALAVNMTELYAGGSMDNVVSWEKNVPLNYGQTVGFYIEIGEAAAASSVNAVFFGSSF